MPDRDGYIPGVPCWVDTAQPDPHAAASFYGALFGWEIEDVMPPGSAGSYLIARIRGRDVAAIAGPEGAPARPAWGTYISVASADETAGRVRDAGGEVLTEPFDVMEAGRMAIFADPEGAAFRVWEARQHAGAGVVNEHGAVNFNTLSTRDPAGAESFYGAVFGWRIPAIGDGVGMWRLPGYGDHLEEDSPGLRERMAELGAPVGFEDVVAALSTIAPGQAGVPAHWSVTFGTDDVDATAERAGELGGRVLVEPFDVPWARTAVIADPQGATFMASQFVLENRDLAGPAQRSTQAA